MSSKNKLKVVVLHNQVGTESTQDELDVITQVNVVSQALSDLGYNPVPVSLSLDLQAGWDRIKSVEPEFIFNLVESIAGTGRFIYFATALLDHIGYPYTGSETNALYLTTNKLLSKAWIFSQGVAAPAWFAFDGTDNAEPDFDPPYILKPAWEDASVGLSESSVFDTKDGLRKHMIRNQQITGDWFAETYISGREFNISVLADSGKPQVLPPAEIEFIDYPSGKPKIVDYRAKWETESFEYQHTVRQFDFPDNDAALLADLNAITMDCWNIFNLHGYARVDFRVDQNGKPWVLEINANPCISPDSGFVAAAERAGLNFITVVERIINDIPQNRTFPE